MKDWKICGGMGKDFTQCMVGQDIHPEWPYCSRSDEE